MRDCKLIVIVRDDKVNFEGQDISVEELAQIAGFLQVFVGMEGLKRGLDTKIDNYRKTDILQPSDDMVLEQDKVIMAGDINVTVRNVVQSVRGKE